MECVKSFQITVDSAVCPALLGTFVTPTASEGVAATEPTGLMYVAPFVGTPTDLWQFDTSGAFLNAVPLGIGMTKCRWIEYIPSTNHFHIIAFDTFSGDPLVGIMDINGNFIYGVGGGFLIPDGLWGPISYDTTINRSFLYSGMSNLLELNGDVIARTINIGISTHRVSYANGKIYCPNSTLATAEVQVFNYATGANVTSIPLVDDTRWSASVGTKVFVLLQAPPVRIAVIDSLTDTVTNTIAVDAGTLACAQLSYLPETGLMYLFTAAGGYAIDPVTEAVICQFSAVNQPSNEYALYGGTGVDTQPAIFIPEFNTTNLRKYG